MSKKLFYGGVEVIPNDPRLPQILADIVDMITAGTVREELDRGILIQNHPGVCNITDTDVENGSIDLCSASKMHYKAFYYKGTYYPNRNDCTVADCLNRPGFKVEDNDELQIYIH